MSPHNQRGTIETGRGSTFYTSTNTILCVTPLQLYIIHRIGAGGGGMGWAYVAAPTPGREGGLGKHHTHRETSQPTHSEFTCRAVWHLIVVFTVAPTFHYLISERRGGLGSRLAVPA